MPKPGTNFSPPSACAAPSTAGEGLSRPSDFVGERAIGQRFGEMHAGDFVGAVEIGESVRATRSTR
jgi:hypothetical protein